MSQYIKFIIHMALVVVLTILVSCQSCMDEYTTSPLAKKYDVALCVLSPDTAHKFSRSFPIEVFVGTMIPANSDNIYEIKDVTDPLLFQLILDNRKLYRCYYSFHENATVKLKSNSKEIQLSYIDHGVYRCLDDDFKIYADSVYTLEVNVPGVGKINRTTKVLQNIIVEKPDKDTLVLDVDSSKAGASVWVSILSQDNQGYFRNSSVSSTSYYGPGGDYLEVTTCQFEKENGFYCIFTKNFFDTTLVDTVKTKYVARLLSKELANYWQPSNFSFPLSFEAFNNQFYDYDIVGRSNVGGGGFVGVFGSVSITQRNFYLKANWIKTKL